VVLPIIHPSSIVRGQWGKQNAQVTYLQSLFNRTDLPTPLDITKPPPGIAALYPSPINLELFRQSVDTAKGVAIDIETAGKFIMCVGLTVVDMEKDYAPGMTLCVRFKQRGGGNYHAKWPAHLAQVTWFYDLMADPTLTKIFQNGITFDVPELLDAGFEVVGPFMDTMHMAHLAHPEQPKGLQFLSTLHLEMPVWKTLTDGEEIEGKD